MEGHQRRPAGWDAAIWGLVCVPATGSGGMVVEGGVGYGGESTWRIRTWTSRLWGCEGDATQTNRLTSSRGANILSAIRHTVPWQARPLLYLIRLPLISLICPRILKPICRGSPNCSLKFFSFFISFLSCKQDFVLWFIYLFISPFWSGDKATHGGVGRLLSRSFSFPLTRLPRSDPSCYFPPLVCSVQSVRRLTSPGAAVIS